MSARDFSVMPVQVEGEPKAIERAVRRIGKSLNIGAYCDVEFGARWEEGRKLAGQWHRCEVTGHEGAIVYVKLAQPLRPEALAPCVCREGWIDDGHDAEEPCPNPECPWWQGPTPAAMNLEAEKKKPS